MTTNECHVQASWIVKAMQERSSTAPVWSSGIGVKKARSGVSCSTTSRPNNKLEGKDDI